MHHNFRHGAAGHIRSKHGRTKPTPEYQAWVNMRRRCENSKAHNYARYGGRGITVCDRWRDSFENFLADMGERPSPIRSLDRRDNNGHYEPGNCRWAAASTQTHNSSNARMTALGAVLLREMRKRGSSREVLADVFETNVREVARIELRHRWPNAIATLIDEGATS